MIKTFVLKNKDTNCVCRLVVEDDKMFLYTPTGNYMSELVRWQLGSKVFFVIFHEKPNIHLWHYINKGLSDPLCCGLIYEGHHFITSKRSKSSFAKMLKNISTIKNLIDRYPSKQIIN